MRRTDSTSLRSLTVSPPFRAIHTNTKPRSRWRLPWSLDSTMYCRSLRTLNAQRCTVGPQLRLLYFAQCAHGDLYVAVRRSHGSCCMEACAKSVDDHQW